MKKNNLKIFCISLAFQFFVIVNMVNAGGWDMADLNVLAADVGLSGNINLMILNLTKWLLGFAVVFSVVALIWGGINYIGSSGDAQKAELAKKIIYYAVIGLVTAGVASAIVIVLRGLLS